DICEDRKGLKGAWPDRWVCSPISIPMAGTHGTLAPRVTLGLAQKLAAIQADRRLSVAPTAPYNGPKASGRTSHDHGSAPLLAHARFRARCDAARLGTDPARPRGTSAIDPRA